MSRRASLGLFDGIQNEQTLRNRRPNRLRRMSADDQLLGLHVNPRTTWGRRDPQTNEELVASLSERGVLRSENITDAFLAVPRADFLPEDDRGQAYIDMAVLKSNDVHMSAPHLYVGALEALDLRAGMSFLNIGSGTGYLSTIASLLLGPASAGSVNHGVEVKSHLVAYSHRRFADWLHTSQRERSSVTAPILAVGNCFSLNSESRQYDRIYCGAALPAHVDSSGELRTSHELYWTIISLLKPGGTMAIPVGDEFRVVTVPTGADYELMATRMREPTVRVLCRVAFKELVVAASGDTTKLFAIADEPRPSGRASALPGVPPPGRTSRDPPRRVLARLRACRRVVRTLQLMQPLPPEAVFVLKKPPPTDGGASEESSDKVRYTMTNHVASGGHRVRAEPSLTSRTLGVIRKGSPVMAVRERRETEYGVWIRLAEIPLPMAWWPEPGVAENMPGNAWMLAVLKQSPPIRYLVAEAAENPGSMDLTDDFFSLWVDQQRPLHLPDFGVDEEATEALRRLPPDWSEAHDAQLARLIANRQLSRANISAADFKGTLQRYSLLHGRASATVYTRAVALLRVMELVDSVLDMAIPYWGCVPEGGPLRKRADDPFGFLRHIRHLMPMSEQRGPVLERCLARTAIKPSSLPRIFVDRRRARSLPDRPKAERDHRETVTYQTFGGLSVGRGRDLKYRWSKRKYGQWWEVNYRGEGVIDQGGGFRDLLAEISDELCPPKSGMPVLTPLFIRTPNHENNIGEMRACFIPSPSCTDTKVYEWLGKVMGAIFRSNESLPLVFPPFVWKKLLGEPVTWDDFACVDQSAADTLRYLGALDEEAFNVVSADDPITFTVTLSDGSTRCLTGDGTEVVTFHTRDRFIELSKAARMDESSRQMDAVRKGFLSSVPSGALCLVTASDLEQGVCGDPVISVAALRASSRCTGDLSENEPRVQFLWDAVSRMSNTDRGQFLRFVTGRRRLPCSITVSTGAQEHSSLPTSATCANTLYLPPYPSVAVLEEKLRYAMYNCIAIDTDTNPW